MRTPDGVDLHVAVHGDGPPLVLVHGTTGSSADWVLLGRELASSFRVVSYDRRGRGRSGDGPSYAFERELDDLRAVLDTVGEPAHLVGHSFGARIALEVAADAAGVRTLTLYEPPLDRSVLTPELLGALAAATRAEDWEAVLRLFHPLAGMPEQELAGFRRVPGVWDGFLDGARTVEREAQALAQRDVDLDAAARVAVPSQLLMGELTDAPVFFGPRDALVARLGAVVHHLPGQRHTAMVGSPRAVAERIRELALQA